MSSTNYALRENREIRPFTVLEPALPYHFWLMQLTGFVYFAFLFASRDYTGFGLIDPEFFDYSRCYLVEYLPIELIRWTTLHFIYFVVPLPGVQFLEVLQYTIVLAGLAGAIGLWPRKCAWVSLLIGLHLSGFVSATNSPFDGTMLPLCMMLCIALAPARAHYALFPVQAIRRGRLLADYQWPVWLLMFLAAGFYTICGLDKLIEIGPHWAFVLHLEKYAARAAEMALFNNNRLVDPVVAGMQNSYVGGVAGAWLTLIAEAGCLAILFVPRYRLIMIGTLSAFHVLVFLISGINFLGNIVVLALCLDWNRPFEPLQVCLSYEARQWRSVRILRRLDWFARLRWEKQNSFHLGAALVITDTRGDRFTGAYAWSEIAKRVPALYPLVAVLAVPGVVQLSQATASWAARKRPAASPRVATAA